MSEGAKILKALDALQQYAHAADHCGNWNLGVEAREALVALEDSVRDARAKALEEAASEIASDVCTEECEHKACLTALELQQRVLDLRSK